MNRLQLWIAVMSGVTAIACTAQPSTPSARNSATGVAQASQGPTLTGSIAVAGDFGTSGTFATRAESLVGSNPAPAPEAATCADYAKGFGNVGTFAVPEVHTKGDHSVYFRGSISFGYSGPGTYRTGITPGLSGAASVTVGSSVGGATTLYNPRRGGNTTLTVASDGSGSFTFSRWASTETRGTNIAGYLDGTVQWTCR
jgi:hypothetical protein